MKKRLILTLLCVAALCALLSVTAFADALPQEATPTTTFTATGPYSGTLSGLTVGRWYYISSESHTVYTSDTSMELSYVRAEPLHVKLYGISGTTSDSDYQEINVTRQPAPTGVTGVDCTTAANNDGKLTGITTAMEYKYSTDSVWTDGTGSDITGLVPGTYNVRTKAAGTALSSAEINVIVHRYYTGTLYDIAVNDVHVTTDNYTDIFSDGKVSYDPTTDKLSVAAFNGNLTIVGNGTVDIEIDGGTDIAVNGDLTVTNANNVTVICDTTTNYTIVGKADITCTGDVNISNPKDGAVWGKLIVNSAKNVTVSGGDDEYAVVLDSGAEINCTGDVKIDAGKTWASCYGDLTIKNAANVTVKGYNNSDVSVNCTGAVLLQNSGNRIGDDITITGATNVTMLGEYSGSVVDDMNITCSGDVLLKNTHSNGGPTVYGTLTVTGARNVTAEATYNGGTLHNATLTCSGNVNITNHGTGQAIYDLTVNSAKNVNVIGAWTYAILGNADITSSGNVLVKNTGSGKAVHGTVDYARKTGAGDYYVKTGESEYSLTTVAANAESAAYNAASCEQKVLYICAQPVYVEPSFQVKLAADIENGELKASAKYAYEGATITVTTIPAEGCGAKAITVTTQGGKDLAVTDLGGGTYSFRMPCDDVTVSAEFACLGTELCPAARFTDTDPGAWYHDGIHFCVENDLMKGVADTLFDPTGITTRGQIVTILWRLEGEPIVNYAMSFEDAEPDQWYTEAIRWAQANKIVEGYSADRFGTNDPITREQLATILYRYAQYKGEGFTGSWMFLLDFVDSADISSWADEAVHWCVMKGIVNGRDGKVFDPQGNATRAEAAAMLRRFCEALDK